MRTVSGRVFPLGAALLLLPHLFAPPVSGAITPPGPWHYRNPLPIGKFLYDVAAGPDSYVAVGRWGTIHHSTDGVSWEAFTTGKNECLLGVVWGGGRFVAVGRRGRYPVALVSRNGKRWARVRMPTGPVEQVAYGSGTYVAVGRYGNILTSVDGRTWKQQASGTDQHLLGVTWGNGRFVAVGDHLTVLTSTDGARWQLSSGGQATSKLTSVTCREGLFVAVGYYLTGASYDGRHWEWRPVGTLLEGVAHGKGKFVAVGRNPRVIMTSVDGLTWKRRLRDKVQSSWEGVTFGRGKFVAVGYGAPLMTSSDGVTWTERSEPSVDLHGVAWGDGLFAAVGESFWAGSGVVLASPDGKAWQWSRPGSLGLLAVAHGGEQFVAVGRQGTILVSNDGHAWEDRSPPGDIGDLLGVAWGNGLFVAVGEAGTVLVSDDGDTWEDASPGIAQHLTAVTWGEGLFVAVGKGTYETPGVIGYSPDGRTWTHWTVQAGYLSAVDHDGSSFVAVGQLRGSVRALIATSADGITWENCSPVYSDNVYELYAVTHGGGAFIAAGWGGRATLSSDGTNWDYFRLGVPGTHAMTFGANGTFVAAGANGVVAQSAPWGPPP